MASIDWKHIDDLLDGLSSAEKADLIEYIARSIPSRTTEAAEQRQALNRLLRTLEQLPVAAENTDWSNRDHDQILYGNQS